MQFWKWTWEADFQKRTWKSFMIVTALVCLSVSSLVYFKCLTGLTTISQGEIDVDLYVISSIYILMTVVMLWLWRDMCSYFAILRQNAGVDVGSISKHLKNITPEVLRRQTATHDPPGDTFTMVGIGFTFVGLVWATFSIDAETIGAIASGERSTEQFIRAATMFGLSLCVGLMGSLYGVALALLSRGLAAKLIGGLEFAEVDVSISRQDSEELDRDLVELEDRSGELTKLANAAMRQIDNARTALLQTSRKDIKGTDIQSAIRDAKRDLTSAKTTIKDLNARAGLLRDGVTRARDELKAMR